MKRFETPQGYIEVHTDTYDGNPIINVANTDLGQVAPIHLDNYQTYQLAIYLLQTLEVDDTRGSK